jgi:putative adhesin
MTPRLTGRAGALTLIAATTLALTGCTGVGAKLTYTDTEKNKVTDIVLDGHSGDVQVTTAAVTGTTITRIIRNSTDPHVSYRLDGTDLHLDTQCGPHCTVSYQIQAPTGVAVRGSLTSGDVTLTDVGAADLAITSGDVMVRDAAGAVKVRTTSGDIAVTNAKKGATLQATSGDIRAVDISGGPVSATASSGDVTVRLGAAGSVTAQADSGDVMVNVPAGRYQLKTHKGSGDMSVVGITNDPRSAYVLDLRVGSGDLNVAAA